MRTHRVAVTGGVELAVDTWAGPGRGLLLVHGLASNARMWDGVAGHLADLGHAVAAVDLRGHGRSDKPDWGYDFATVCDDLAAVVGFLAGGLEGLGQDWSRPVVVGQSWGANLVVELAWRQPRLTAGVACVDGGTIELTRHFDTWEACARAMAPPRLAGTPARDLETMIRAWHPSWPESGIRGTMANFEVRADATVTPWLSYEHHMMVLRGLYDHRPSTRYPDLAVPVLLLPAEPRPAGKARPGGGPAGKARPGGGPAGKARPGGGPAGKARPGGGPAGETRGGANLRSAWTAGKRAEVEAALAAIPTARAHWFHGDHDIHAQFPAELAAVLHQALSDGFLG